MRKRIIAILSVLVLTLSIFSSCAVSVETKPPHIDNSNTAEMTPTPSLPVSPTATPTPTRPASNNSLGVVFPEAPLVARHDDLLFEEVYRNLMVAGYRVAGFVDRDVAFDKVIIPKTHKGLPVLEIGGSAFEGGTFSEIVLPDSIEIIRYSAFSECTNLSKINRPTNLKTVSGNAFYNCKNLSNIEFLQGEVIESQSVLVGTKWYDSQKDGVLYFDDTVIGYKGSFPQALTINGQARRILVNAFDGSAFGIYQNSNPENLKEIIIEDGIVEIGNFAFQNLKGLRKITLPNTLEKIGFGIFIMTESLKTVTYTDNNEGENGFPLSVKQMGMDVFKYSGIEQFTFNEGVEKIPASFFGYCKSLSEVKCPSTLTEIGMSAFMYCENLGSTTPFDIPKSVVSIGDGAFDGFISEQNINFVEREFKDIPETITLVIEEDRNVAYHWYDGSKATVLYDVIVGNVKRQYADGTWEYISSDGKSRELSKSFEIGRNC